MYDYSAWGDGTARLLYIAKALKSEINSMTNTAKALRHALNGWSGSTTVRRIGLAVFAILWSVGWAEIQPTQSLIGAILAVTVIYGLATTPVTVKTGP